MLAKLLDELNDIVLAEKKIEIVTFSRTKDAEGSNAAIMAFLSQVKKYKILGVFPKDSPSGKWYAFSVS